MCWCGAISSRRPSARLLCLFWPNMRSPPTKAATQSREAPRPGRFASFRRVRERSANRRFGNVDRAPDTRSRCQRIANAPREHRTLVARLLERVARPKLCAGRSARPIDRLRNAIFRVRPAGVGIAKCGVRGRGAAAVGDWYCLGALTESEMRDAIASIAILRPFPPGFRMNTFMLISAIRW